MAYRNLYSRRQAVLGAMLFALSLAAMAADTAPVRRNASGPEPSGGGGPSARVGTTQWDCEPFSPSSFPCFQGPFQNGYVSPGPHELVDDLSQARLLWISEEQALGTTWGPFGIGPGGQGKSSPVRAFGYSNPIVVSNRVYLQYSDYPPDEKAQLVDEKMVAGGARDRRRGSWSIDTDDVVLCMSAENGRTLWKTVFERKGLTTNGNRHGLWQHPCVVGDRLFAQGSGGYVYCIDATTGETLWIAGTGPATKAWDAARDAWYQEPKAYDQRTRYEFCTSPTWGDGVVAVNDHGNEFDRWEKPTKAYAGKAYKEKTKLGNGLVGLDATCGKLLWRIEYCTGRINSPIRWRHQGKDYFLAHGPRKAVCVEPRSGRILWTIENPAFCPFKSPVVAGDIMVVGGMSINKKRPPDFDIALVKGWYGYRISLEGAEKLWTVDTSFGASKRSPAVHQGNLFCAIGGNRTVRIDLASGEPAVVGKGVGNFVHSVICGDIMFDYMSARRINRDGALATMSSKGLQAKMKGEAFLNATLADGRLYLRGKLPGIGKQDLPERVAQGLPPEHGCIYCFDLRK